MALSLAMRSQCCRELLKAVWEALVVSISVGLLYAKCIRDCGEVWEGALDCCDPALLAFRAVAPRHLSG